MWRFGLRLSPAFLLHSDEGRRVKTNVLGTENYIFCKYKVIQSIQVDFSIFNNCMKASYLTPASSSLGASRRVVKPVQVRGDHKNRFSGIKVFSFFSGLFGGNKDTTKSEVSLLPTPTLPIF